MIGCSLIDNTKIYYMIRQIIAVSKMFMFISTGCSCLKSGAKGRNFLEIWIWLRELLPSFTSVLFATSSIQR
jgi:hypothetical protein